MDPVLEASLVWGDVVLQRVSVPFWDKLHVADVFEVPDELGARVIDFGPKPFVGERKIVSWGSLAVIVEVAIEEAAPPRARGDVGLGIGVLAAAAVHLLLFAAGRALPTESEAITADRLDEMRGYLSDDDVDTEPPPRPERAEDVPPIATEGRLGLGAPGPRTGSRGTMAGGGALGAGGDKGSSRATELDAAATFGVAGLLGTTDARGAGWGRGAAESGLGWMEGGGLELSGVGEGGGGTGRGVDVEPGGGLGLSGAGKGGSCDDMCSGSGLGSRLGVGRPGIRSGGHVARAPVVCGGSSAADCAPTIGAGRLPAEAIQRVVRANMGRFRLCYENGLARNPSLQGRVVVEFLIGRDGTVSVAKEGTGSSPFDLSSTQCVVRAFAGLSFPEPTGGTVSVTYPLVFSAE